MDVSPIRSSGLILNRIAQMLPRQRHCSTEETTIRRLYFYVKASEGDWAKTSAENAK